MEAEEFRELTELLSQAETLQPLRLERTVFSVGARGHFEKPVSDLLAFFIDPGEEHGLGDLFLRALIECARPEGALPSSVDVALEQAPAREVSTDLGNRLDILILGRDWALVVENKIYAGPSNPFQDYETYVAGTYAAKRYRAHIVLGMSKPPLLPSSWRFVSYQDLLSQLKGMSRSLLNLRSE